MDPGFRRDDSEVRRWDKRRGDKPRWRQEAGFRPSPEWRWAAFAGM